MSNDLNAKSLLVRHVCHTNGWFEAIETINKNLNSTESDEK